MRVLAVDDRFNGSTLASAERIVVRQPTLEEAQDLFDLERIIARDPQGFLNLYDRRAAHVLGLLVHLRGDHAKAEELLVQTFDAVWRRPESCPRASGLKPFTWLLALARERALHDGSKKGQVAGALHQKIGGSPVGIGAPHLREN